MDWKAMLPYVFSLPTAVVIIASIFIFTFRKQIGKFIDRTERVSKDGVETGKVAREQKPSEQLSSDSNEDIKKILTNPSSELVKAEENLIFGQLKEAGLSLEGDSVNLLVRDLAEKNVLVFFLDAYRVLFGSQITLLDILNKNWYEGLSIKHVSERLDKVKEENPKAIDEWDVEKYLEYLLVTELVIIKEERCFATIRAREFLAWVTYRGFSEDKPL